MLMLGVSGAACATGGPGTKVLDQQLNPDGVASAFSIPAGQVLVVIGVDWRATGGTPGASASLYQSIAGNVAWIDTAFVDTTGAVGSSTTVGGVIVKSGTQSCLGVLSSLPMQYVIVHGFLAKDK